MGSFNPPNMATEKQVNFLLRLVAEKGAAGKEYVDRQMRSQRIEHPSQFERGDMSTVIDGLMDLKVEALPNNVKAITGDAVEGMHKIGDRIFKVQRAIHGSGNLYAKELLEVDGKWKFEYAAGMIRKLSESTLMTLEEAKQFGALYGTCCACGRTLTNEISIEAGIGPICAGRFTG